MSQQLINRSPDLKRLRDEGYEIAVKGGFLIIHHIPYVNNAKQIKFGLLVSELTLINASETSRPGTHVIYFQGEHPCDKEGRSIAAIQHSSQTQNLTEGVTVNHSFSNKPSNGYTDYHEKVTRYIAIISAPAEAIDPNVTAQTYKVIVDDEEESIFRYLDTNSSRANVNQITSKLKGQRIAIIGLGGTGSYILDSIAKTPVLEIHLFDGDYFHQHNAFRSPGAASIETLNKQMKKVFYYENLYSNIRKNIIPHDYNIREECLSELDNMSYVFIAIDKGSLKKPILRYLLEKGIPSIDVGMGINRVEDFLIGILRVTTVTGSKNDHLTDRISTIDDNNDEYNSNIQIAELNSLNGALAVIKWKKLCGFYQDLEEEHHSTYSINVAQLLNEDLAA